MKLSLVRIIFERYSSDQRVWQHSLFIVTINVTVTNKF